MRGHVVINAPAIADRVLGSTADRTRLARYLELAPKYWARTRARLAPAELANESPRAKSISMLHVDAVSRIALVPA